MTSNNKVNFQIIPSPAQHNIDHGPSKPISEMTIDEIPPVAISWGRSDVFKTGAWRNVTPHYVKRLPPCRSGCPVGNDIKGWLVAAGKGNWDEAARLLIAEQPLPSICGRVCYHPCETACNRGEFDGSVSIRSVERVLGDKIIEHNLLPEVRSGNGGNILVIGSGPAGLSAAWMLALLGHSVEIHERADEPGGLLRYGIPAYRLPRNVLSKEINRLEKLGVTIRCGMNPQIDSIASLKNGFDALFLSPGAAGHRSSGIKGATQNSVLGAIEFLTQVSAGSAPDIGSKVLVIGGGNSAIDAARTALRIGSDVTILYRRTRSEMPAYHEEVEAALEEGVKIEFLISPVSLETDGVQRLRCIHTKLGAPDDSGRRRPEPIVGSEFDLPVDMILDAVGEYPDITQLTTDNSEVEPIIDNDSWGRTELEGVFVGGDFIGGDRTVAHAIGSGKRSGMVIDQYLRGNSSESLDEYLMGQNDAVTADGYINRANPYDRIKPVQFHNINMAYHPSISQIHETETAPNDRASNFNEIVEGLSYELAINEANRCFHCGECDDCGNCHVFCPDGAVVRDSVTNALSFDLEHCKGCGICEVECPRAAIEMVK